MTNQFDNVFELTELKVQIMHVHCSGNKNKGHTMFVNPNVLAEFILLVSPSWHGQTNLTVSLTSSFPAQAARLLQHPESARRPVCPSTRRPLNFNTKKINSHVMDQHSIAELSR